MEEGTLVLKQLAESLALQNANSFDCELSRNQRPLAHRGGEGAFSMIWRGWSGGFEAHRGTPIPSVIVFS